MSIEMAVHDEEGDKPCIVTDKGDYVDRFLDIYLEYPHSCFSGCCCSLFFLTVISIMSGSMTMTLGQESAWSVHTGEFTRASNAYMVAKQSVLVENRNSLARRLGDGHDAVAGWPELPDQPAGPQHEGVEGLLKSATHWAAGWGFGAPDGSERRLGDGDDILTMNMFYKVPEGSNVFAPEHLKGICEFEQILLRTGACEERCISGTRSPMWFFYGNATREECPLLPQANIDAITMAMQQDVAEKGSNSRYAGILHPVFEATNSTFMTKSSYKLDNGFDDVVFNEMFQQFDPPLSYGFLRSAFQADEDRFAKLSKTSGSLRVRVYYETDEFSRMIWPDFGLAVFSFIFVWLCMWMHLGSCFLASVGMYQILVSLPVAGIIYRQLARVDYFEFLHILVVYLVLGIGADDLFVLVDSWRHITADPAYSDNPRRALRATWSRANSAVFNTSFTTSVAFLSMSVSKVMPMRTCGWYAAICICMNYLFVILFSPATLLIFEKRFRGKRCCCPNPMIEDLVVDLHGHEEPPKSAGCFSGMVERGLREVYLPAMQWQAASPAGKIRPIPVAVVAIMLTVGIQGAYFSSQLTPPSKTEEWFPDTHMWYNLTEFTVANSYQPSYNTFDQMVFVWGIEDMNFDDFVAYKPDDNPGRPIYDSSFDLTTSEAQESMLNFCQRMREVACDLSGCKNAGSGKVVMQQGSLVGASCFLEDMRQWYNQTAGTFTLPTGATFLSALQQFREEANPREFSSSRGELVDVNYISDIGFLQGELKYVSVRIRSTLPRFEPYGSGSKVRTLVRDFVEQQRAIAPVALRSIKVSSTKFASYDLGAELISGLFSGCAIALPVSFLVILISTRNILLALYAVSAVGFIVLGVLGFCRSAMGWDLGIAEAVAGVIVIGYSVDYVVHLAHIYCEATHHGISTRVDRATFAIENIGSTVFAGALTTAGSGAVMFFCFLTFFFKMALLICVTISYSFLFSLFFFMGLAFCAGPAESCGDITALFKCCARADKVRDIECK